MSSRLDRNKKVREKINSEEKSRKRKKKQKRMKKMLIVLIIIFVLGIVYARFIEPNMLFVNEKKIVSSTIETNFNGLKIVHFSDLHFGSTVHEKQLVKYIKKINELKPDIVVFTGDLIEAKHEITAKEKELLIDNLKNIEAKYGKYAILGNHDYENEHFNKIIYDSDFILLNNSYDVIYSYNNEAIGIYGIDDLTYGSPNMEKYREKEFADTKYKVILVHEPDYIDKFIDNYKSDLILAGHSHNQQVRIPYVKGFWLPKGSKNYYEPYYNINDTPVYISNGLGTSLLNLRFLSPPSINLYRINKEK